MNTSYHTIQDSVFYMSMNMKMPETHHFVLFKYKYQILSFKGVIKPNFIMKAMNTVKPYNLCRKKKMRNVE